MALTIIRRYDPTQPRGADGRWGGFNMDGFTGGLVEIEGTFGRLAMGADDTGDVRLAFREGDETRELDLTGEDLTDLSNALVELAAARSDLPEDADPRGVYEDARFGDDSAHTVELFGSGVIEVTFGADDEDPWRLSLDPPDGDDDDTAAFLDAIDDVLQGGPVDRAAVERSFDQSQRRDNRGKWSRTAWSQGAVSLSSGPVEVGALGGDEVSIGAAAGEVELSADISFRLADLLRDQIGSDGSGSALRVGSARDVANYQGDQFAHEFAGVTRVSDDQYEIDLATGDGNAPPETAVLLTVSADEMRALAEAMERKAASRQVDTSQGMFASVPTDQGVSMTLPATAGDPINVTPSNREAADLSDAIRELIGAIDEFPEDDDGNPLHGPDDAVATRTVKVGGTEFTLKSYGQYGSGRIEIQSSAHDWHLVLPDGQAEDIAEALDVAVSLDESVIRSRSPENGDAPVGGQFAVGGGRVGGKGKKPGKTRRRTGAKPAAPTGPLTFDGTTGSGYGIKGGDPRVRTLQAALSRLGITDSAGKGLAPDGRYGPKTTSAVKKLQKALGIEADGKVTPELLKQVTELKQLPTSAPRKSRSRRPTSAARRSVDGHEHVLTDGLCLTCTATRSSHEHVLDNGICTTCPTS